MSEKTSNPAKTFVRSCRRQKIYDHEIAALNFSKNYFLENAKKTCKPNNRDLDRD